MSKTLTDVASLMIVCQYQYKFVILPNVNCIYVMMLYKFIVYDSVTERMDSSWRSFSVVCLSHHNQDISWTAAGVLLTLRKRWVQWMLWCTLRYPFRNEALKLSCWDSSGGLSQFQSFSWGWLSPFPGQHHSSTFPSTDSCFLPLFSTGVDSESIRS